MIQETSLFFPPARTNTVQSRFRIAAIGELLWDMLPGGPQLGGAPANFAAMAGALGDESFLISRAGDDQLGHQAVRDLAVRPVGLDFVALDPRYPTGTVTVSLNREAVATYIIHEPVAWDNLPFTPQVAALAPTLDAVCFGTLAQRSATTRQTLRKLVEATVPGCVRVFDVNLREPYWNAATIAWGCSQATIVKMNHEEVPLVAHAVDAPPQVRDLLPVAKFLLEKFPVRLVAITRGSHGSLLVTRDRVQEHAGIRTDVIDTIGAGDAFTAALTHYALRQCSLEVMAEGANRWGAWVASQRGGMPTVSDAVRAEISRAIEEAAAR